MIVCKSEFIRIKYANLTDEIENNMKQKLINKLSDKTAVIGIVGLDYVGIPLALRYAEAGCNALGFGIDQSKIDKIS